ncbi:MAG: hypothetical protein ACFFAJ_04915 [Candidatus Hodarchaeota archaeon]
MKPTYKLRIMQNDYLYSQMHLKRFQSDHIVSNSHEMFVIETDLAWNSLKGVILEEIINERKILLFDDTITDRSILKPDLNQYVSKSLQNEQVQQIPLGELLKIASGFRFSKISEKLQDYVWKAIGKDFQGIFFIFNFEHSLKTNRISVLNLERVLAELFRNSFGFQIMCNCLYPSSLGVKYFAELVALHTRFHILDKYQDPLLNQSLLMTQSGDIETNEAEKQQNLEEIYPSSIKDYEVLSGIAKRAISGNAKPFYFQQGDNVIGIANDLESCSDILETIPLDVFCFHCYRTTSQVCHDGKNIDIIPRSDLALWIQYSIGDTKLAHQIYETIRLALGRIKCLASSSKLTQLTMKSTILRLIRERISTLSSV